MFEPLLQRLTNTGENEKLGWEEWREKNQRLEQPSGTQKEKRLINNLS